MTYSGDLLRGPIEHVVSETFAAIGEAEPHWQTWDVGAYDYRGWVFSSRRGDAGFFFPLWFVPLAALCGFAVLLRSAVATRRDVIAGLCTLCGYSLAGLAQGAACPECGKGTARAC